MGYLSQKKKHTKTKDLLNVSLVIIVLYCFAVLFFKNTGFVDFISHWMFHIYLISLFLIIYSAISKFFLQMGGFILCECILFLHIGMGGNLFFNVQTPGLQSIKIFYHTDVKSNYDSVKQIYTSNPDVAAILKSLKDKTQFYVYENKKENLLSTSNVIISKYPYISSGEILLSPNGRASFAELNMDMQRMMIITLDFSRLTYTEKKTSLKNLAEFINMQDIPVVVVGQFGLVAWSKNFLSFLEKTKLEVKNKAILSDGHRVFNPLSIPSINILAYKDFGIRDMKFLTSKSNSTHPLLIELNY